MIQRYMYDFIVLAPYVNQENHETIICLISAELVLHCSGNDVVWTNHFLDELGTILRSKKP